MRSRKHARLVGRVAGLLGLIAAASASAQAAPEVYTTSTGGPAQQVLTDRFVLDLGGFVVSSKISGRLNGTANTSNQDINFDQRFGTDADSTRLRAAFLWRITPRQAVDFAWFNDSLTRTRTIDSDLAWGDLTFKANGQVTAQTRFNIYEGTYEFSFLNAPTYKLAVLAGVHVDSFTLKLSGDATVTHSDGTVTAPSFEAKSNSVTAPLPVIGLGGEWAATDHLYLNASGQVFKARYEGIDGHWSLIWVGATWMFNHHFGIGVAYDRFKTTIDLSKGSFNGSLDLGYQGGVLYVKAGF
jgi:hypothetical protein